MGRNLIPLAASGRAAAPGVAKAPGASTAVRACAVCKLEFRPAVPGQQVCTRDHDADPHEVARPGTERSSNALARELGMTGARLRQIEAAALGKARVLLERRGVTAATALPETPLSVADAQRAADASRTRVAAALGRIGLAPPPRKGAGWLTAKDFAARTKKSPPG